MARGESFARRACKQEVRPTEMEAGKSDAVLERRSAELPRRVRHQQAPVGGGDSSRRSRRGAWCADYAGHRPSSVGYDDSYDPDNEMSNSDSLEESSTSSDDELFFPICIEDHWIVTAVDFKWKLFAFLDSFYDKDSYLHKTIREKFIKNFINLWEIIFQTDQHNLKTFKRMYPHVPKQKNGNDCRVFATKVMEIWDPTLDLRKIFSHEDIQHIRIQYMNQLFFGRITPQTRALSLVRTYRVTSSAISHEQQFCSPVCRLVGLA